MLETAKTTSLVFIILLGAAMLIEKKFFTDIGKFNENMFLFFSDYDLCKKIRNSNRSVILVSTHAIQSSWAHSPKTRHFTRFYQKGNYSLVVVETF